MTASGSNVFESGNNWREVDVTVIGQALSTDADLSSLAISPGTLDPSFSASTTTYTANVANSVTSMTVTPTTSDSSATMTVNGDTVTSGTAHTITGLTVGDNTVTIIVTAQDATTKTYTITVTRAAPSSTDADLSSLAISPGTLDPSFSASTTTYTANVANSVTSMTVTPTTSDSSATMTVNGNAATSGTAHSITGLTVGDNTVTIIVTAQDATTKTYTITVTRAAPSSTDADLSSLAISPGTLDPSFSASTTTYTANVANSVTSMTVTPTTSDSSATMTVNGNAATSGTAHSITGLTVGDNTVTIIVTAQDATTKTYTITVTRAAPSSTDADLSSLAISPGTLDPSFSASTTTYTANVANSVTSMTVTPTTSDSSATMTVNGNAATSGTAHSITGLTVGDNTVTIIVTAQDATTKTYTITVTRADIPPPPPDTTAPRITSARVSGSDTIIVSFSERVQGSTGAPDWSLDGAPGVAVDSATGLPGGSVELGLSEDLPEDKPELTLGYTGTGIEDLAGNPLGTATIAVSYPSSDRSRGQSAPPVFDIGSVIKSYPQSVPEWVSQAVGARDPGTPIPPISINGTFAFPLEINSMGYLLDGPVSTIVPAQVAAGQPVTITVTVHDPTPIAYFAVYLNLQGSDVSHLDSDAQVIWNYGQTYVVDRSGLMQDVTVTLSEDPDDPTIKTFTITVTLSEGMGKTNMAIRTWNAAGQLTEVQVFDAIDVRAQEPEPVAVDPEPAEAEPELVAVDPEPAADDEPVGRDVLAIRMWSGFEPESISDAQLLASLDLDYPGADIPSWVMTELGTLTVKGDITVEQFRTALEYVLEYS